MLAVRVAPLFQPCIASLTKLPSAAALLRASSASAASMTPVTLAAASASVTKAVTQHLSVQCCGFWRLQAIICVCKRSFGWNYAHARVGCNEQHNELQLQHCLCMLESQGRSMHALQMPRLRTCTPNCTRMEVRMTLNMDPLAGQQETRSA